MTSNKIAKERDKPTTKKDVISELEKRRRKLAIIAFIAGVTTGTFILVALQNKISNTFMVAILVILFMFAFIVNVKLWRCPSCNGHLGKLHLDLKLPKYCPHCGTRLVET